MSPHKPSSNSNCLPVPSATQMGPSVGIDSCPSGLLYRILEYVHGYELGKVTGGSLCSSLVVCRKWHAQARLVLYRDLHLDLDKLGRFLAAFDHDAVSSATYKMAIRLHNPKEPLDTTRSNGVAGRVDQGLRRLAQDVLPRMRQLRRFALSPFGKPLLVGVQKTTVAALLAALPTSCRDLALRARLGGEGHLCGTIRDLAPRMDRFILAVSPVCHSILGEYSGRGFRLNSLPKSLWFIISWKLDGAAAQACPESHWEGSIPLRDSFVGVVRHAVHGSMEANVTLMPGFGRLDYLVGRAWLSAERPE